MSTMSMRTPLVDAVEPDAGRTGVERPTRIALPACGGESWQDAQSAVSRSARAIAERTAWGAWQRLHLADAMRLSTDRVSPGAGVPETIVAMTRAEPMTARTAARLIREPPPAAGWWEDQAPARSRGWP